MLLILGNPAFFNLLYTKTHDMLIKNGFKMVQVVVKGKSRIVNLSSREEQGYEDVLKGTADPMRREGAAGVLAYLLMLNFFLRLSDICDMGLWRSGYSYHSCPLLTMS